MVREIRVPSSSNSRSARIQHHLYFSNRAWARTDCDRLDLDAFLKVGIVRIVRVFASKNLFATKSVYEGGAALRTLG